MVAFAATAASRMARIEPVTRASGRDTNAISPDTEIRRCHIGATSADDPCAAAHSSDRRERIETPVPSGDIENAITLRADVLRSSRLTIRRVLEVTAHKFVRS